jgi:two-component system cell cycle response regulator CpdR
VAAEGQINVLVVEDDSAVRTFLRRALEIGGLSVEEASNAAEALARLRITGGVDVMLIDGLLPDMHGVVLVQRLLDDPRTGGMPICFFTGAVQGRAEPAAGISCLPKPVRPRDLVTEMVNLVDWSRGGGSPSAERQAALDRIGSAFLVGP